MLQREGLAGFDGDGQSMEHGVGAATHGDIECESIFESVVGEDVAGADVLFDEINDSSAGFFEEFVAGGIGGENAAVAGEGPAEGFAETVHAVGGEHAGAGAAGWA